MGLPLLKKTLLLICLLGFPLGGFWLGTRYCELQNESEDCISESRFAQLKWMLLAYHSEHGAFPPTKYQRDPNGPVHSWRVLLLPYIDVDFAKQYSEYDFSQEWNSPANMRALCVGNRFSLDSPHTANTFAMYLAISNGEEWPSRTSLNSLLVTKGEDNFLIVEYPDSTIHWMAPRF